MASEDEYEVEMANTATYMTWNFEHTGAWPVVQRLWNSKEQKKSETRSKKPWKFWLWCLAGHPIQKRRAGVRRFRN